MKKVLYRCVNCGTVYDQPSHKECPSCHFTLCDKVLMVVPTTEDKVIVDFNVVMYSFPRVFGVPVTSKN